MDTKKSKNLKNDFYNWCKKNNKQPKSQEEVQDLLITFITENKEKYPEEYAKIQDAQKQAQKALHGAKLQYIRSLKHQCPEGEELYYYKKGGSVGCGCKKKEDGGEVKKDCDSSAIKKFKMQFGNKMMQLAEANKERKKKEEQAKKRKGTWAETTDFIPGKKGIQKPSQSKETEEDKIYNSGKETVLESSLTKKKAVKKEDKDAQKRQLKQDLASSEKCGGKVKKHQEGSVITKFKMHRQGGSLNGIPFISRVKL